MSQNFCQAGKKNTQKRRRGGTKSLSRLLFRSGAAVRHLVKVLLLLFWFPFSVGKCAAAAWLKALEFSFLRVRDDSERDGN